MINVDKNPAYPKAVGKLKKKGTLPPECELRPVKYLNNLVEQDHRFIKRRVNPGMGFWSFDTAWRTLQGYEAMHQLRKGQVKGTSRGDIQARFGSYPRRSDWLLTLFTPLCLHQHALARAGFSSCNTTHVGVPFVCACFRVGLRNSPVRGL